MRYLKYFSFFLFTLFFSCGKTSSNKENESLEIKPSAIIMQTSKAWANAQTLIVTFLDGDPKLKSEVARFANEWTVYANLKFVFYNELKNIPPNKKPDIIISFKKEGNNSLVGTDSTFKSTILQHSMSLSEIDKKELNIKRAVVLHEFGHVLGLEHEHQHIHKNFELDKDKTLEYCKNVYGFDKGTCEHSILNSLTESGLYFSTYDPLSIMHYPLDNSIIKGNISLRYNNSLSLLDKIEIAKIYPGKMTEAQIINSHQLLTNRIENEHVYKNCQIVENNSEKIKINSEGQTLLTTTTSYSYSSLEASLFMNKYSWDDKEGVVLAMKEDIFCNYNENELRDFKAARQAEHLQKQHFGNCMIPLQADGAPKKDNCPSNFPYQIFKTSSEESIDNLCHQSFENALSALKKIPLCAP